VTSIKVLRFATKIKLFLTKQSNFPLNFQSRPIKKKKFVIFFILRLLNCETNKDRFPPSQKLTKYLHIFAPRQQKRRSAQQSKKKTRSFGAGAADENDGLRMCIVPFIWRFNIIPNEREREPLSLPPFTVFPVIGSLQIIDFVCALCAIRCMNKT